MTARSKLLDGRRKRLSAGDDDDGVACVSHIPHPLPQSNQSSGKGLLGLRR